MTVIANQVTDLLFSNVNTLDDLSHEQLRSLAEQYPYFAPLQFLLAAKDNHTGIKDTTVYNRTLLHFPNAIQLDYLLNGGGDANITQPAVTSRPVIIIADEPEPEMIVPETTPEPVTEAPAPAETIQEFAPAEVVAPVTADVPVITLPNETFEGEDDEPLPDDEIVDDGHEIVIPGLKIEAIDPKTAELNLTPVHLHTVDYFASLGIKFKEQDKPVNKFDLQLKSFTDWLKIIKKSPDNQADKANDAKAEQKVTEMAGLSLKGEKIITETMAEVWIKQGDTAKAIEVYQKLSLLDPAKSTYFASRIENLKKSN